MESRAKLFGHAIHPMLIVFPLGLLSMSVIFDIIHFATGVGAWAQSAFWMIGAGIIGGLVAALFGLLDWLAIPDGTRAKAIGRWHGGGNVVVVGLFIVSWLARRPDQQHPNALAFILSVVGVCLALVTGWLGGELVERLGVGVDEGANLDAPNSLSHQPARTGTTGRSMGTTQEMQP
jgi:uncharacterized membrane protein